MIPTYGEVGFGLVSDLLPLLDYTCTLPHEVIVVDDGSDECDELEKTCLTNGASFVHLDQNSGFAKAVNAGISKSVGDIVMITNNDIIPIRRTFDSLYHFHLYSNAGIVGCKLLYPDNRIQHAGVTYVEPPKDGGLKNGWFDHYRRFWARYGSDVDAIAFRPCTGALLSISSPLIDAIGMLDERFSLAAEDVDYNLRAMEAGFPVLYNGQIEAYHMEGVTRGNTIEGKAEHPEWTEKEAKSLEALFDKWHGFNWDNLRAS